MKSADFINECAMRGMATGQTAAFGTVNGVPFTVNVVTAKHLSITFVLDRQISADEKTAMGSALKFAGVNGGANGYTVTVTVPLDPAENSVPTITPWFRNADWNEREFAELFDVHVDGNTNPKRLFLDPEIDEGILNEVIPLTIMMNGACTKDMWERIMEVNAEPGEEVEKGVHE